MSNTGSVDRNDLFSLQLFYDQTPELGTATIPQRNGNISGYRYRTRGRTMQAYAFEYDGLNRLQSADHAQQLPGGGYEQDAYNTAYTYDLRGNMLTLSREGKALGEDGCLATGQIDKLDYDYANGTNKIERITDAPANPAGQEFLATAGFHRPTTAPNLEYQYDANGNMIYDPAKELNIYYNYLNLPDRFEYEDCRTVEITYDAAGNKLRTLTRNGSQPVRERTYAGGLEYLNGKLESVAHAEGRTFYEGDGSRREFNLTDHLGNVRLVFSDLNGNGRVDLDSEAARNEVLMEQNYYPFGLEMEGRWLEDLGRGTRYLYNGKEFSEELGLYDYGARWYDPAVGRFTTIDPLADQFTNQSPYHYAYNNPLRFIDPDGRSADDVIVNTSGNGNTVNDFVDIITESLGGQFRATLEQVRDSDGNVVEGQERLRIIATEGGGDASKLSSGQQEFYNRINQVAEVDRREVHIDPVSGDGGVHVGLYASYPAKIDVADIRAFQPLDPSVSSQNGATQSGKMIHEIMEQFFKQVVDGNRSGDAKGFNENHFGGRESTTYSQTGNNGGATGAEDAVNGNNRVHDFRYKKPNGEVYQSTYGTSSTIKVRTTKYN